MILCIDLFVCRVPSSPMAWCERTIPNVYEMKQQPFCSGALAFAAVSYARAPFRGR